MPDRTITPSSEDMDDDETLFLYCANRTLLNPMTLEAIPLDIQQAPHWAAAPWLPELDGEPSSQFEQAVTSSLGVAGAARLQDWLRQCVLGCVPEPLQLVGWHYPFTRAITAALGTGVVTDLRGGLTTRCTRDDLEALATARLAIAHGAQPLMRPCHDTVETARAGSVEVDGIRLERTAGVLLPSGNRPLADDVETLAFRYLVYDFDVREAPQVLSWIVRPGAHAWARINRALKVDD
ncbi:hypothetical protein AAEX63_01825 [Luteococcus sp. H138]|uniref:hypothetical protein n=1 Tax=Luteococcus sp. H138 TaxID=3139404 RepID=UPI00313C69A9